MHACEEYMNTRRGDKNSSPDVVFVVAMSRLETAKPIIVPPEMTFAGGSFSPPAKAMRSAWSWWLVAAFAFMVLYEIWWIRYFKSEHTLSDFYSRILGVPLAGATLPVIAFFLLGIYGKVIWMLIGCVILGIGHIGIHAQHYKEIK